MLGKGDSFMQKKKLHQYLLPYTRIDSKWTKDLNLRLETVKLPKENTEGKLLNMGLGNDFFFFFWILHQKQTLQKQKWASGTISN